METRFAEFQPRHKEGSVLQLFGASGKATAEEGQRIYEKHRESAALNEDAIVELTPSKLEAKLKHLSNIHHRHPLTDRGIKLLHELAQK